MKRIIIVIGALLISLLMLAGPGIYLWIDSDEKSNMNIAKKQYPGSAEGALITHLSDTTHSFQKRLHVGIWTLGQIQSQKAIPILEALYKNDTEGHTCRARHDSVLCQDEIDKALHSKEVNWWPLEAGLINNLELLTP